MDSVDSHPSIEPVADDFRFIANRMKSLGEPASYDLGGATAETGYHGPIVDDISAIARGLRALEAAKQTPGVDL